MRLNQNRNSKPITNDKPGIHPAIHAMTLILNRRLLFANSAVSRLSVDDSSSAVHVIQATAQVRSPEDK